MELLKPLLSLGALVSVAYFVGALLVEAGGFERENPRVPRTRRQMFIMRTVTFFEYILPFWLLMVLGHMEKMNPTPFTEKALFIVFGAFILRVIRQLFPSKAIRNWLIDHRHVTSVANLIVLLWISASIYLFTLVSTETHIYLAGVMTAYLLFVVAFTQAAWTDDPHEIRVTLTLKSGLILEDNLLIEETSESIVLVDKPNSNLVIWKTEVSQMRVWTEFEKRQKKVEPDKNTHEVQ